MATWAKNAHAIVRLATNTPMRDDLRSANFFADAKSPVMIFQSDTWKSTGGDTDTVAGNLTIASLTKEVVRKIMSLGFGPDLKRAATSGWEVSTTLDRRDSDIAADQGMIGDSVEVVTQVEADLRKPAPGASGVETSPEGGNTESQRQGYDPEDRSTNIRMKPQHRLFATANGVPRC